MKRTRSLGPLPAALLSVLLAGFLTALVSTTAKAQTPLLDIAFNKNTLFQVLSDGIVYLPTGAAVGYVLTTDNDGYASWQPAPAGLVNTDTTLTGDGTAGDPLGVSVPLFLIGNSVDGQVRGEHAIGHFGYLGSSDYGAYGQHNDGNNGILGSSFFGAYGQHANGHYGILGGSSFGAGGVHASGNNGLLGNEDYGVWGTNTNGAFGYFGSSDYGAYGQHNNGTFGFLGSTFTGAYGESDDGHFGGLGGSFFGVRGEYNNGNVGFLGHVSSGVRGRSNGNVGRLGHEDYGASGEHDDGNFGHLGGSLNGAYGENANGNFGHLGGTQNGAYGEHNNGNYGFLGSGNYGAYGVHTNGNVGRLGSSNYGVYGNGTPYAGYFQGDVHVTGTITEASAAFKVDHPLDPENQYLVHSAVESPDMKNVYDGNVTTDARGEAVVELPEYFEVLNRDFRYQLTVIGTFAQAIVAEKMRGNRFVIRTDQPSVEVSWQVTGIRQDRWANENRIVVEQDKPAIERGFYLHPKLYGQPEERSIEWARDPEGMRAMKEMPQQREEERRQMKTERERMEAEHEQMQAERERMKNERQQMQQQQRPPRPRPDNQP